MLVQGMKIEARPTGKTEGENALGQMEEVQIFVTGNGSATCLPGTFWRPKS